MKNRFQRKDYYNHKKRSWFDTRQWYKIWLDYEDPSNSLGWSKYWLSEDEMGWLDKTQIKYKKIPKLVSFINWERLWLGSYRFLLGFIIGFLIAYTYFK